MVSVDSLLVRLWLFSTLCSCACNEALVSLSLRDRMEELGIKAEGPFYGGGKGDCG